MAVPLDQMKHCLNVLYVGQYTTRQRLNDHFRNANSYGNSVELKAWVSRKLPGGANPAASAAKNEGRLIVWYGTHREQTYRGRGITNKNRAGEGKFRKKQKKKKEKEYRLYLLYRDFVSHASDPEE